MATFPFHMKEHVIPCQHIRGYARNVPHRQEETLCLVAKQYIPYDNPSPQAGDVTIIGANAQGLSKELYEPLWAEIHSRAKSAGVLIQSIWIADIAIQDARGVVRKYESGNEPRSASDHARDLLHMVNTFRQQMAQPVIGIGHGMGATTLVSLALLHPSLLETLILVDPVIRPPRTFAVDNYDQRPDPAPLPANLSARRCRRLRAAVWPSSRRTAAPATAEDVDKHEHHHGSRNPRVFDPRTDDHVGLRAFRIPITPVYEPPSRRSSAATTTTTKIEEGFQVPAAAPGYCNAFAATAPVPPPSSSSSPSSPIRPDDDDPVITLHQLPFVRPSALYIFSSRSLHHHRASTAAAPATAAAATPAPAAAAAAACSSNQPFHTAAEREVIVDTTGVDVGGSGGMAAGRVVSVTIGVADGRRSVVLPVERERVGKTAMLCAGWLGRETAGWRRGYRGGGSV